ncbi:hypothetical protein [Pseudobacillus badius]|uniref:hypothetical protein n=1 Tax=Bacillus badius TaxID=1455 RepID=UPI0024A1ACC6|nr:hypothetical protein [Bacillus badius]GLY12040.1 hypothetical protein Bbad01_32560 [Bacillus badius]
MKRSQKTLAGLLSGVLLSTTLMIPVANAQTNQDFPITPNEELQLMPNEGLSNEMLIEIIQSEKENFIDPSYGDYLIEKLQYDSNNGIQTYGKVTLTAKAGAKALKAAMNKIGQKAWDAAVKKMEKNFGTSLVVFHWKSMNQLINVLSNSSTTITDAISDYLVKNGFNRKFANILARTFATIFL